MANVFAQIENAYGIISDPYLTSTLVPDTLIVNDSDYNDNTQIDRSFPENAEIKHVKAGILNHKTIVKLQNGSWIIFDDNANW